MKMRVFKKSIKDLTDSYYFLRSKKILNLIDRMQKSKQLMHTLGGCAIFTDRNHIVIKKENKIISQTHTYKYKKKKNICTSKKILTFFEQNL